MKGTPVLERYVKELLLYNTKNLTVNHEVAVKSIWDIIRQDFGSLLQLRSIMEVEKEEALANLKASGEDTSQLKQISSLFEPLVSLLCQACNSALYHSEKKYPRNFN